MNDRSVAMPALPLGMIGVACLNLGSTAFFLGCGKPQFPSSVKWAGARSCLPVLIM